MKAAFSAEAIGLGARCEAVPDPDRPGEYTLGKPRLPWVAEITGTDPRFGLRRVFVRGKFDCRGASRDGTRGVLAWWTLESGKVYQARYRTTWRQLPDDAWVTRWLFVTGAGDVVDIPEEEAWQWAVSLGEARAGAAGA